MDSNSAMKDRTNCYIKLVCENYTPDEDVIPVQDVHLVFRSKKDYYKISNTEKMFKRYFELDELHLKIEKKLIIYYHLKEMIRQLKEYEVMEVLSDHVEAFGLEFNYIVDFISNRMELELPRAPLIVADSDHEDLEEK